MQKYVTELKAMLTEIEALNTTSNDSAYFNELTLRFTTLMARSNLLMAEYDIKLKQDKKDAYLKVFASLESFGKKPSPSLIKDYVDSLCTESAEVYVLAERTSRSLYHAIESLKSVSISLMNERKYLNHL